MPAYVIGEGILVILLTCFLLFVVARMAHAWIVKPIVVPWLHRKFGFAAESSTAILVSALFIVSVVALSYLPGRLDLSYACSKYGQPQILERVSADGYFVDSLSSNWIAFLIYRHNLSFVEARAPTGESVFLRYTPSGKGQVQKHVISKLESRYGVREEFSTRLSGVGVHDRVVYEMGSKRELGRATSFSFHGGPLVPFLLLNVSASCVDVLGSDVAAYRKAQESFLFDVLGKRDSG